MTTITNPIASGKSYADALKTGTPYGTPKVTHAVADAVISVPPEVEKIWGEFLKRSSDIDSGNLSVELKFYQHWIRNRNSLHSSLTYAQRKELPNVMARYIYEGPFFYNVGSWLAEAEAVWMMFDQRPALKTNNGINLVADARQKWM